MQSLAAQSLARWVGLLLRRARGGRYRAGTSVAGGMLALRWKTLPGS